MFTVGMTDSGHGYRMADTKLRDRATQLIYQRLLSKTYREKPDAAKTVDGLTFGCCEAGAASLCGWRREQEDRFGLALAGCSTAVIGVFDGHGGSDVAEICGSHIPSMVASALSQPTPSLPRDALSGTFLAIDTALMSPPAEMPAVGAAAGAAPGAAAVVVTSRTAAVVAAVASFVTLLYCRSTGKGTAVTAFAAVASAAGAALAAVRQSPRPSSNADALKTTAAAVDATEVGATAICAVVNASEGGASVCMANAGDCRAVASVRAGATAEAISTDHKPTVRAEKRRILLADSPLGSVDRAGRINGELDFSRAIGDLRFKRAELPAEQQVVTAVPECCEVCLEAGGLLLLACDGVWDVLSNEEAIQIVRRERARDSAATTAALCCRLLDDCLARGERAKAGSDNMTCVLIEVRS